MARTALTTAWTLLGTAVTGAYLQNFSDEPILVAVAAATPPETPLPLSEVGYLLQAGDFLPLSGLTAGNVYARTVNGSGFVEVDTIA